jgi:Mrp family chromosome partitioning ATPase
MRKGQNVAPSCARCNPEHQAVLYPRHSAPHVSRMALADRLRRHQLVVVTGKGGVGKTTVSAALGRLLAADGRRVLLLEVDPRENLHHMLGVAPSGGEIVAAGPRLFLQNVQPVRVVEDLVRERLKVELLVKRVLASPVFQHFVEGGPGFKELAILIHAQRLVRAGAKDGVDVVVLDAPATGHGVSLLAAPMLVSEAIPHGPVGHLAAELAAFVADATRCGIVLVTSAEEMPVQESIELIALVEERLHRAPECVVVNGLYPPVAAGLAAPPAAAQAMELWRQRRATNERELARLAAAWSGPRYELPLLAFDRGPDVVAALEACLGAPA